MKDIFTLFLARHLATLDFLHILQKKTMQTEVNICPTLGFNCAKLFSLYIIMIICKSCTRLAVVVSVPGVTWWPGCTHNACPPPKPLWSLKKINSGMKDARLQSAMSTLCSSRASSRVAQSNSRHI